MKLSFRYSTAEPAKDLIQIIGPLYQSKLEKKLANNNKFSQEFQDNAYSPRAYMQNSENDHYVFESYGFLCESLDDAVFGVKQLIKELYKTVPEEHLVLFRKPLTVKKTSDGRYEISCRMVSIPLSKTESIVSWAKNEGMTHNTHAHYTDILHPNSYFKRIL